MRTMLLLAALAALQFLEKSTKHGQTCPNGHTANSEGKCFTAGCPYYVRG